MSQSKETDTGYVLMDKTTHEELRRNIEDYKKILIEYEKLKSDLVTSTSDNKLNTERLIRYQKEILDLQEKIMWLNRTIQEMQAKLDAAGRKIAENTELYNSIMRMHYKDQATIYKIKNYKTRFETQGMVIGGLVITIIIILGEQSSH